MRIVPDSLIREIQAAVALGEQRTVGLADQLNLTGATATLATRIGDEFRANGHPEAAAMAERGESALNNLVNALDLAGAMMNQVPAAQETADVQAAAQNAVVEAADLSAKLAAAGQALAEIPQRTMTVTATGSTFAKPVETRAKSSVTLTGSTFSAKSSINKVSDVPERAVVTDRNGTKFGG